MKEKRIVTIGGGTGSFTLLSGLKKYPVKISAVVSMADDGGSTGILRDELGVLPPGDVRQCLVALSDSSDALRELLNYRFEEGALKGHNFGNLFLSALEKINGSFNSGVDEASKILNVEGEVIPVTNQDARLFMELRDGKILDGQNEIDNNYSIKSKGIKRIFYRPEVMANPKAIKRILEADLIVIGPGNHFSSIAPNFFVDGISAAIVKSKGKVVYNCNLVNKKGHTEKYKLDKYVNEINNFIGKDRIDFVTFNTKLPSRKLINKYKSQEELLVEFDETSVINRSYRVIRADLISSKEYRYSKADSLASERAFIRHDSNKLAKLLIMIMEIGEYEDIIKSIA